MLLYGQPRTTHYANVLQLEGPVTSVVYTKADARLNTLVQVDCGISYFDGKSERVFTFAADERLDVRVGDYVHLNVEYTQHEPARFRYDLFAEVPATFHPIDTFRLVTLSKDE